jgi:hypothetical protein
MLVASYHIGQSPGIVETGRELLKEFGVVLISVWGVSLFYEKFLAERHFNRFQTNLEELIRRGETNAAVCEGLGILEIHRSRRSFEDNHSLASEAMTLKGGDVVRISGRSLIFSMYGWQHLSRILENGATLQLCLLDPAIRDSPLSYLAGYSPEETDLAIRRFRTTLKPWLDAVKPRGSAELRFHRVHLLDSLLEIDRQQVYRVAWDLNFGVGIEERQIFYLDGHGPLGRNLTEGRYGLIWEKSTVVFSYKNGVVEVDRLTVNSLVADFALDSTGSASTLLNEKIKATGTSGGQ